jgi:hypothetical protein
MNQIPSNAFYSSNTGIGYTSAYVVYFSNRDPTIYDVNFPIQKFWFNVTTSNAFILVNFSTITGFTEANWQPFSSSPSEGGLLWQEITTSQVGVINNGYITNSSSLITLTLPSTAVEGNIIAIVGKGSGGWRISLNSGQSIIVGTGTTTVSTGSVNSTYFTDCIEILCTTGGVNSIWTARSFVGNLTII